MSASQPALFNIQEFTDAGVTLVGGRLYTYAFGTTAQKVAYTDPEGTIPQTYTADGTGGQYIGLNARGELPTPLYLAAGAYDISLKRADGSTVWTRRAEPTADMTAALEASFALISGANLMGFDYDQSYRANSIGWGVQTCGGSFNLRRLIPPSQWAAIAAGTSTLDVTAIITTAIATFKDVWCPPGVYSVNPDIGVLLVKSMRLRGAGQNLTIFAATAQGATMGELASYSKGSIFKREFTLGIANARLDTVHLSDFSVVMNHPTGSITASEIQIGLDLRHIGRFQVDRVWVGNIAPLGGLMAKADPGAYASQGYGIVTGNIDTGNVAYCGGEVGRIDNCSIYGAYKLYVNDDQVLSPLSGAHAINVTGCDLQGGHHLLVQEQQYTSGFVWDRNTVQDIRRQPGNVTPTYVMRIAGYDNEARGGYIEAGIADYLLRFDSASRSNRVYLTHYSATTIGIAAFSDLGRLNRVECSADSGALPGGVDSKGQAVVRYDRSYQQMSIGGHWDGSNMIMDGGFGLTATRPTTAGDYVFTFALGMVDANRYTVAVSYDTNASGHGGMHSVISRSPVNIRIQFYSQNGAVSTAIDPRWFSVCITQF